MAQYRSVLEVQKFLSAKDALQNAATVSSQWRQACESSELWHAYCEQLQSYCPSLPPRSAYRVKAHTAVCLAVVKDTHFQVFNCVRMQWEEPVSLGTNVLVDFNSSAVFLSDGNLLLCGGCDSSAPVQAGYSNVMFLSTAYRISPEGNVRSLPRMIFTRSNHGLVESGNIVYAFGGKASGKPSTSALSTCEKWCVSDVPGDWERLPDMSHERWGFNPCALNRLVYLFSPRHSSFDIFHVETEVFTDGHWSGISTTEMCCLFTYNDEVMVLMNKRMCAINVSTLKVRKIADLSITFACGSMNPIVQQSRLYQVDYASGMVFCFDINQRRPERSFRSRV